VHGANVPVNLGTVGGGEHKIPMYFPVENYPIRNDLLYCAVCVSFLELFNQNNYSFCLLLILADGSTGITGTTYFIFPCKYSRKPIFTLTKNS
jgi:hypothetical protein